MSKYARMCKWLCVAVCCLPLISFAKIPVKTMVIFGDSLSDTGNTTHLLKSLKKDESPSYLVNPFKVFVINKMTEYADEYYIPQMVLDAGIGVVTTFFDEELAPMLVTLISKVRSVPVLPGDPYWHSRFSNGRVWNEYLAPMLVVDTEEDDHYINHAYGGSWTQTYDYQLTAWNLIRHPINTLKTLVVGKLIPPSLGIVIQGYLLNHKQLDSEAVYFVFAGANDYLNVLRFEDNYNPSVLSAYVDNVVGSMFSSIGKLTKAGARHVVVIGLPSLGNTPRYVNTMDKDVLNLAAQWHNERLAQRVQDMKALTPEVDYLFIDLQSYFKRVLDNPDSFGMTSVSEACIDVKFPMITGLKSSPFYGNLVLENAQIMQYQGAGLAANEKNYHVCDTPETYLFWDEVHPSTKAHRFLAYDICKAMQEHGYDTSCIAPKGYPEASI